MEKIIINALVQLGAVGILVAVLIWLVIRYEKRMGEIHNNHTIERTEWRIQAADQHNEIAEIAKNSNVILTEIKTMFKLING